MRRKKRIIIIVAVVVATPVLALLIVWRLAVHTPGDYHPTPPTAAEINTLRHETDSSAETLYNNIQRMDPFIYTVSEKWLNEVLLLGHEQVNDLFMLNLKPQQWISGQDVFHNPQLRLDNQRLDLMGTLNLPDRSGVATFRFWCRLDEQENLRLSLEGIQMGLLPLPVDTVLGKIREKLPLSGPDADSFPARTDAKWIDRFTTSGKRLAEDLLARQDVVLDPVFPVDDDRQVRIVGFSCDNGRLELLLQPEPLKKD